MLAFIFNFEVTALKPVMAEGGSFFEWTFWSIVWALV